MHTRRHFLRTLPLAGAWLTLGHVPLAWAELAPNLASQLTRWLPGARLAGEGRLRMFGFHIYDAQLYVGAQGLFKQSPAEVAAAQLGAQPFALHLRYARAFKGRDIAARSRQEMEKIGLGSSAEQQAWEAQLANVLPDVEAGTQLIGLYVAGRGTLFLSQGKVLGEIAGVNFARAFFGIWLDPRTTSPDVRLALLKAAGAQAS